jgi:hypothetical protein
VLVLSLQSLLEEAASDGSKFSSGNVRNLAAMLEPANLARLRKFARVCCFLAFHPTGDPPLTEYLRSGTLPDDSGPDVLVLFTLDEPAPIAVPIGQGSFTSWAEIGVGAHPAYRLVQSLFEGKRVPALPGLVVFEEFAKDTDGIYIPLGGLDDERSVRLQLRQLFSEIGHAGQHAKPGKLLRDLGVRLHQRGIGYERTGRRPMREWLQQGFQFTRDNYGDIVSTIGLFT